MPTLRVRDLKIGEVYREPLSGYAMRVRDFERDALGNALKVVVVYHNKVSGRFVELTLRDGELEAIEAPEQKR